METVQQAVEKLLNQIRAVTANPAIIRASDEIQVLCAAHLSPDVAPATLTGLEDIHFTPSEAKALALLYSRRGKVTDRDALVNVMAHHTGDGPSSKIVDVRMSHIRKKIKGRGYDIETLWGVGYRMTAA